MSTSTIESTYGASPIKRGRRTKANIAAIRAEIYAVVERYLPMTVRQVFYQLVTRGVIDKTEAEYKRTVCRLTAEMRRANELPYRWIADNTRWMRKPDTYSSLAEMLELTQQTYRRALWNDQDAYVEIWLEKEALAGVLVDVTAAWDVPLMITRGYPSLSYIHSAAMKIASESRPCFLYHFGDHDPSGCDIDRALEETLRDIGGDDIDFSFQRVAVTPQHIRDYNLLTRPTKKTDSRSKGFEGESVEVDALDPDTLRELCRECITRHVDPIILKRTCRIEEAERATLAQLSESLDGYHCE